MVAWLVTWEWDSTTNEVQNPIVSVLDYRRSTAQIRIYLEYLWIHHSRSLDGLAKWAKHDSRAPQVRGRHIEEEFTHPDGTTEIRYARSAWDLRIGTDPYLRARLVDDLEVDKEDDTETMFWRERKPGETWNDRPKKNPDEELKSHTREYPQPLWTTQ